MAIGFLAMLVGLHQAVARVEEVAAPIAEVFCHNEKNNYSGTTTDMITGTGMNYTNYPAVHPEWPTNHPSLWVATQDGYADEWQSGMLLDTNTSANAKIGWAIFDLGKTVSPLITLYIWNNRQATGGSTPTRSANIYYSSNPTIPPTHGPTDSTGIDYDFSSGGWTLWNTSGVLPFNLKNPTPGPADNVFTLGQIAARYIAIEMITNNGSTSRVGLSEVGISYELPPKGMVLILQ